MCSVCQLPIDTILTKTRTIYRGKIKTNTQLSRIRLVYLFAGILTSMDMKFLCFDDKFSLQLCRARKQNSRFELNEKDNQAKKLGYVKIGKNIEKLNIHLHGENGRMLAAKGIANPNQQNRRHNPQQYDLLQ